VDEDWFPLGTGHAGTVAWSLRGRSTPHGLCAEVHLGRDGEARVLRFEGRATNGAPDCQVFVEDGIPMVMVCSLAGDPDEIVGIRAGGSEVRLTSYRSAYLRDYTLVVHLFESSEDRIDAIKLKYGI
jgi:hypothetical protein